MPPAQAALTFTGSSLVVVDLTEVPEGHSVTRLVATALDKHFISSGPDKNSIIEFSFMSPKFGNVLYEGARACLYEYPCVCGKPGPFEITLKNSEALACAVRADRSEDVYWVRIEQTELWEGPPPSFQCNERLDEITLLSQDQRPCPRAPPL